MRILPIVLSLVMFACANNEMLERRVVPIDLTNSKPMKLSDRFEDISYILMEQKEDLYLAAPYRIVTADGRLFIEDIVFGCVFVYSEDGKLMYRIGEKGEGPGQYNSVGDFNVADGKVYIKDVSLSKVLEFGINGEFIREVKNDFGQADFLIQRDFQLWYLNNSPNHSFRIMRRDQEGEITPYLSYDTWMEGKSVKNPNGFVYNKSSNSIIYQLPLSYDLLVFDRNGFLTETITLDFGEKNFDAEDRDRLKNQLEYIKFAEENFLVEGITNFLGLKGGYLSILNEGSARTHFVFFDPGFKVIFQANELLNDIDGLNIKMIPWASSGDELYCISSSNELLEAYKQKFGSLPIDRDSTMEGTIHELFFENQDFFQQENTVLIKLTLKSDWYQ